MKQNQTVITEEMVARYYELNKQAKQIEKELSKLKRLFNEYFDLTVGINQKGTLDLEDFVLQRQIRQSEKFREQEMIQMLEKLKLEDCIRIEKRVDEYKVNAAITLGILPAEQIAPLKIRKYTQVISVKEK